MKYYDNMTLEMQEVYNETMNETTLKEEFFHCHKMYLKAKDAGHIHLPAKAASGKPVLFGAKKVLFDLEDYWLTRRNLVEKYLAREWVDSIIFGNEKTGGV